MVGSIRYTGETDDAPLDLPTKGARMAKGQDMVRGPPAWVAIFGFLPQPSRRPLWRVVSP